MRKILCRFWKLEKHWEKFFSFGANGVWTCSGNLCQLWREYMRPAVNVLPNSRKISNLPKREMFSISICAGLMENYDQSGAVQILSMFPWARSLLKAVLKQELSCIQITTFSEVNTFQNIWTMNLKLFLKMRKILCTFQKWKKKIAKALLVLEIMAFEPLAGTYLSYEMNTSNRQSRCYQTVLRFKMFSNLICARLMEN